MSLLCPFAWLQAPSIKNGCVACTSISGSPKMPHKLIGGQLTLLLLVLLSQIFDLTASSNYWDDVGGEKNLCLRPKRLSLSECESHQVVVCNKNTFPLRILEKKKRLFRVLTI